MSSPGFPLFGTTTVPLTLIVASLLGEGEPDPERRARSLFGLVADRAVELVDRLLGDGKPKARPTGPGRGIARWR